MNNPSEEKAATPADIVKQMDANIAELTALLDKDGFPWAARSAWRLARAMRATALLADITTRRIEKLTVILIILTTAIFLLGAAQLIALILK
jgi:hypothetical protein